MSDDGGLIRIAPEVEDALADGRPVVALESTLISHGLPSPENLETAAASCEAVRSEGAVPATIAVLDGRLRVGLERSDLERLASEEGIAKLSRRDLPLAMAAKGSGTTTVAATMLAASRAGIRVFATGGIGGVHRGAELSFDISADLAELARTDMVVVCSGAKAILDLPRTLEMLETAGVPVLGWRTDSLPGFWTAATGLPVDRRIERMEELAAILAARRRLGVEGGVLLANPVPADEALDPDQVGSWIEQAVESLEAGDVKGKDATPHMLAKVAELSGGLTLRANVALIVSNARLAGEAAACLAGV